MPEAPEARRYSKESESNRSFVWSLISKAYGTHNNRTLGRALTRVITEFRQSDDSTRSYITGIQADTLNVLVNQAGSRFYHGIGLADGDKNLDITEFQRRFLGAYPDHSWVFNEVEPVMNLERQIRPYLRLALVFENMPENELVQEGVSDEIQLGRIVDLALTPYRNSQDNLIDGGELAAAALAELDPKDPFLMGLFSLYKELGEHFYRNPRYLKPFRANPSLLLQVIADRAINRMDTESVKLREDIAEYQNDISTSNEIIRQIRAFLDNSLQRFLGHEVVMLTQGYENLDALSTLVDNLDDTVSPEDQLALKKKVEELRTEIEFNLARPEIIDDLSRVIESRKLRADLIREKYLSDNKPEIV